MKCKCGDETILIRGGNAERCNFCNRELLLPTYFGPECLAIPAKFHNARLKDYRATFPTDIGLFIYGPAGTGKTHLAVSLLVNDICNIPMSRNFNEVVAFTSMINLLSRIRQTFSKSSFESERDIVEAYQQVENLYLDDIGVEQATDWALTLVYQIIDYRWANEKRTVFTSNFDLPALAEKLDTRISSRIGGMCEVIELSGKDRRTNR